MNKTEKLIYQLKSDLKKRVIEFLDSQEKLDGKYLLNSKISKGSPFEGKDFCSHFTIFNTKDLDITSIIFGDENKVDLLAEVKIACASSVPKEGKELNNWSHSVFTISINAKVSYNKEKELIDVLEVKVFSR